MKLLSHIFRITVLCLVAALCTLSQMTTSNDGKIDRTFGQNGVVQVGLTGSETLYGNSNISISSGNKIVSIFTVSSGSTDYPVATRLNQDGSLDATFGTNGLSRLTTLTNCRVLFAVVQPDGKVVAGGYNVTNTGPFNFDFLIFRIDAIGQIDTSFGSNGRVVLDLAQPNEFSNDYVYGLDLLPDGRMIASGISDRFVVPGRTRSYASVARFNSNGTLDTTFGSGGVTAMRVGDGNSNNIDITLVLATQLDATSRLMIGTSQRRYESETSTNFTYRTSIIALTPDGVPDLTFSEDGITDYQTPTRGVCALYKTPDNKTLVLEGAQFLRRLDPDGTTDTTFGIAGVINLSASTNSFFLSMTPAPDGKLIFAGMGNRFSSSGQLVGLRGVIIRLYLDGTRDIKFGSHGTAYYDLPQTDTQIGNIKLASKCSLVAQVLFGTTLNIKPLFTRFKVCRKL